MDVWRNQGRAPDAHGRGQLSTPAAEARPGTEPAGRAAEPHARPLGSGPRPGAPVGVGTRPGPPKARGVAAKMAACHAGTAGPRPPPTPRPSLRASLCASPPTALTRTPRCPRQRPLRTSCHVGLTAWQRITPETSGNAEREEGWELVVREYGREAWRT